MKAEKSRNKDANHDRENNINLLDGDVLPALAEALSIAFDKKAESSSPFPLDDIDGFDPDQPTDRLTIYGWFSALFHFPEFSILINEEASGLLKVRGGLIDLVRVIDKILAANNRHSSEGPLHGDHS